MSAKESLLALAKELCEKADASLLYLSVFGSRLYGTDLPDKSDTDLRGIFLPSLKSLALNAATPELSYSTGDSASKNSGDDCDICLYSLQKFLLAILPKGEIAAIDLLFAPSHPACVLYQSPLLAPLFASPARYLDIGDGLTCANYCIHQARKYGIAGSLLGGLKTALAFIEREKPPPETALGAIAPQIVAACADPRYCALCATPQGEALRLGSRIHMSAIKIGEFTARLKRELARYDIADNIDFKALSHAMRAIYEMEELLTSGEIRFPLAKREELIAIKTCQRSWPYLEKEIASGIAKTKSLCANNSQRYDPACARDLILRCYGL